MNFIKKHKIIFSIIFAVVIYFTVCTCLYLFEPVSYSAPNLNDYAEYFNMYSYFSSNLDDEFYIKQISADDISCADNDERVKFVTNTAIAVVNDDVSFDDVATLLSDYDAEICGYIKDINFYQIEFSYDLTYYDLEGICQNMTNVDDFIIVLPDYFEEMPTDYEHSTTYSDVDEYYYELINAYEAWDLYYQYNNDVNVGIIDVLVDYNNPALNVANKNYYVTDSLNSDVLYGAQSHGTHVAGIINAKHSAESKGMASEANIYSYNGVNVSTSYWIASICDMLLRKEVKVINISMGYNSYISISAQLSDENALNYIKNENILFSAILSNIINSGKEFVICISAGNSTTDSLYKTPFAYFGYGEKDLLSKLDVFGIFESCPEYVDAKYSFFVSDSANEAVSDRIITVGCIGEDMSYTFYSNAGNVDIAAPGEDIYSTVLDNKYGYMSGTSMSAPFVSGTAAMIFTVNPELTGVQVKDIILESATQTVSAHGYYSPVLNSGDAVASAENY